VRPVCINPLKIVLAFLLPLSGAVIDGYLIDHDPPVQITSALSQGGIKFNKGEEVELIDTRTGKIDLAHAPEEIKFDIEGFDKAVVTVPFNKAVEELARHIDPNLPGKALIFGATDAHAGIVVARTPQMHGLFALTKRVQTSRDSMVTVRLAD
jgi:type I restriction enzyme, R subunit